jgi:dephospho-CoA kinase
MNKLPKIIALCGYKGSGKDTVAEYLVQKYKYNHYKISEKLKEVIKLLFNLNDDDLERNKDEINDKWGIEPRKIMQFIGTDMFQYKLQELFPTIEKSFWIKSLFTDELINKIENENHRIVISDLRFLHEYNLISNIYVSYSILKVQNNNLEKNDKHISENEFNNIPINAVILNNSTKELLYNNIDNIAFKMILKSRD